VNNTLIWTLPALEEDYITAFDVRDTGAFVSEILNHPQYHNGKKIRMASEHLHPQDYIIKLGLIANIGTTVELVRPEYYQGELPRDVVDMFAFFGEYTMFGKHRWDQDIKMVQHLRSFDEYIRSQTPGPAESM